MNAGRVKRSPRTSAFRSARQAAGFTQSELAELAGCSQGSISAYDAERSTPDPVLAKRLSILLRRPVSELFPAYRVLFDEEDRLPGGGAA